MILSNNIENPVAPGRKKKDSVAPFTELHDIKDKN